MRFFSGILRRFGLGGTGEKREGRGEAKHLGLGRRAEDAAAKYLKRAGYRVVARNVKIDRLGEVDIVAVDRERDMAVIVEVKAGRSDAVPPEVHVNHAKQRKLAKLAWPVVKRLGLEGKAVRFDVVAVVWVEGEKRPRRVTHHVAAFEAGR